MHLRTICGQSRIPGSLLLGLLLGLGQSHSKAQTAPGYLWTVASGTSDTPLAVSIDNQGQVRTVGNGGVNLYFHAYDTNGNILQSTMCTNWATFLGGAIDPDGNVYATGSFGKAGQFGKITLTDSGNGAMFLAKYSPTGTPLWAIGSTGGAGVLGWAVAVDPAGNAYVTGEFMGSTALQVRLGTILLNNYTVGSSDAFVAKIDPNGKILWATRLGDGGLRRCMAIAADKSGNVYLGANPITSGSAQSVYKFDTSGNLAWSRSSKPASGLALATASATAVAVDGQGNVCVTGAICGTNLFGSTALWTKPGVPYGSDFDIEVTKYDPQGNVLWASKDGGTNIDGSVAICFDRAGNAFVEGTIDKTTKIGSTTLTNDGVQTVCYYIAKCEPTGAFAWATLTPRLGGQGNFPRGPMSVASDGSVYFAGVFNGGSSSSSLSKLGIVERPVILTQPTNQTLQANSRATLIVQAAASGILDYQWYRGVSGDLSTPVAGAVSNVLTTPPLTETTSFWVRVTNPAGIVDSDTATITIPVVLPPKITAQPQGTIVSRGQSFTLSVIATGTEPLSYQWYQILNGNTYWPIAGAVSNEYTTGPLTNTATLMVRITNVAGVADSDIVAITVVAPLEISQQPQSLTITNGQAVTLSVTATGGQFIFYQWFIGNSGDTNNPIAGANFNPYTTPPLAATTCYWVLLRTVGSTLASQTAVLTLPATSCNLGVNGISGGKINLRVSGPPGSKWSLQTSTDLVNWLPVANLGEITLGATGATNLQTVVEPNPRAFYRAGLVR